MPSAQMTGDILQGKYPRDSFKFPVFTQLAWLRNQKNL